MIKPHLERDLSKIFTKEYKISIALLLILYVTFGHHSKTNFYLVMSENIIRCPLLLVAPQTEGRATSRKNKGSTRIKSCYALLSMGLNINYVFELRSKVTMNLDLRIKEDYIL